MSTITIGKPYPRCSIVVRAFNEEQHIERLIAGIAQQTVKDSEVILVDSGSTDATVEKAVQAAARFECTLRLVQIQPAEFTFGRSLNSGIAQAQGDLIVIASAHVYPVYPDWLERLLTPFDDPQIALTYGKQRGNATSQFSERQIFAHWFPDVTHLRQETPFCNNANAAIRRSVWVQHPYDETLSGLEDLAWAKWAMSAGYAVAYIAEAEIIHVHSETPGSIFNRYRREAIAFKRIFPEEQFYFRDFLRLASTNIISDLWHAGRQQMLWPQFRDIVQFRLMQFWGTYRGYRHSGPLTWQLRQTFYYPRAIQASAHRPERNVEPIQYSDPPEAKTVQKN